MCNLNFFSGVGIGLVAGSALAILVCPRMQRSDTGKTAVSRCLKNMGNVVDGVSDALK